GYTPPTYLNITCGCGGIGRRAALRSLWGNTREGSSPFIRTMISRTGKVSPKLTYATRTAIGWAWAVCCHGRRCQYDGSCQGGRCVSVATAPLLRCRPNVIPAGSGSGLHDTVEIAARSVRNTHASGQRARDRPVEVIRRQI